MGIREEREAQAAQFVSVHDLLEGLATTEKTNIGDVAGYLLRKLSDDTFPEFVRMDAQSLAYFKSGTKQADKLLRHVSYSKTFENNEYEELSFAEFETYGWFRKEIAKFLEGVAITPPPCCSLLWKPEPKRPDWFKAYENRNRITVYEAARLLNGIDPEDSEPFHINDEGGWNDLLRWEKSLLDAVDSGAWDFDHSSWGADRGEQTLLHSGIKEWAGATCAPWPFLDDTKTPAPESPEGRAIANELKAAKNRIVELEKKLIEVTATKNQPNEIAIEQSPLMKIVTELYRQFWSTFDKDALGAKAPAQTEIVAWAKTKYSLTDATAKAVEKVACPIERDPSKK